MLGYVFQRFVQRSPLSVMVRGTLERVLGCTSGAGAPGGVELGTILATALEGWVRGMADQYNDGHRFAHPAPRHGWPSPLYDGE